MNNARIADAFDEMADLLEFQNANPFRVRAYRNAARRIRDLRESLAEMAADPERSLTDISGIGADLAEKIRTLVTRGELPQLVELQKQVPHSVLTLLRIPGLGPKKAAALFHELGVKSLEELREACEAARVRKLKGFGQKTEQLILDGLSLAHTAQERIYWSVADQLAQALREHLQACPAIVQLELAGSYRRGKETVGDLDVLVVADPPQAAMDCFAKFEGISAVLARGDTKMSVRGSGGLQIDMRVVPAESFGAALQYFTGSKDHNVVLRGLAKQRGLKINEYGVFRLQDGQETYLAGRTEAEVYATLELPEFPPELREARQEFEWAAAGQLPRLIELADIRGDLHMHTTDTDGQATLREMIEAARARGLEYIAITDHSQRVRMARGLDPARLLQQWAQIDALRGDYPDLQILKGIECDILEPGGLDLPDEILAQADWVLASVHYGQKQSRRQITERILGALENPHVSAIAHPTGRLINRRDAYEVDMEAVFRAARERGKILELNANPARLDLHDVHCATAKSLGIPLVINSDTHSTQGFDVLRYGILQARRGGLTAEDVLNTRRWPDLQRILSARRQ